LGWLFWGNFFEINRQQPKKKEKKSQGFELFLSKGMLVIDYKLFFTFIPVH